MDKIIVALGISLLVLGVILAILMISIIVMYRAGRFGNFQNNDNNMLPTQNNNDELIAVITATISMYYLDITGTNQLFKVKSIKKANRR